jgi:sensor c-di-GMP phosphodiesterase-like protein
MDTPKLILKIIIFLAFLCWLFSMTSCTTSNKLKQSSAQKKDSSIVSKTHKQSGSITDSTIAGTTESSYNNNVNIVFDDDTTAIGIIANEDAAQKAVDLAGPKKALHVISIGNKTFSSSRPIKSISINLSGNTSQLDITRLIKIDSGQVNTDVAATVHTEEKNSSKEVHRKGANVFIWIGLGTVFLGLVYCAIYFGIFRKKKLTNII